METQNVYTISFSALPKLNGLCIVYSLCVFLFCGRLSCTLTALFMPSLKNIRQPTMLKLYSHYTQFSASDEHIRRALFARMHSPTDAIAGPSSHSLCFAVSFLFLWELALASVFEYTHTQTHTPTHSPTLCNKPNGLFAIMVILSNARRTLAIERRQALDANAAAWRTIASD